MKKLVNFKLEKETSIKDAWTKLRELRRRIGTANPARMALIIDNDLFEYLLRGLPEEYSTTCSTLDAQINLEIPEKLFILQKQQDKLANATSTNPIALVANHKPYRQDRQERNLNKAKNSICFLCGV